MLSPPHVRHIRISGRIFCVRRPPFGGIESFFFVKKTYLYFVERMVQAQDERITQNAVRWRISINAKTVGSHASDLSYVRYDKQRSNERESLSYANRDDSPTSENLNVNRNQKQLVETSNGQTVGIVLWLRLNNVITPVILFVRILFKLLPRHYYNDESRPCYYYYHCKLKKLRKKKRSNVRFESCTRCQSIVTRRNLSDFRSKVVHVNVHQRVRRPAYK